MHKVFIPAQNYNWDENQKAYIFPKEDGAVGLFELLWMGIHLSQIKELNKNDHKVVRRLKKKLRDVSEYKDQGKDSRIVVNKQVELWLEGDEYSIMKRLLEANSFTATISDEVDILWECIDTAQVQELKPTLSQ